VTVANGESSNNWNVDKEGHPNRKPLVLQVQGLGRKPTTSSQKTTQLKKL